MRRLSFFLQLALLLLIVAIFYLFITTAIHNLHEKGIATGFGFLQQTAGFEIIFHLIDYSQTHSYFRAFCVSLINTIFVSLLGVLLASIIGLIIALSRLSNNWLLSKIALVYIEFFRNIPLLLQIFFWYFVILRNLPLPKQSYEFLGMVINIRGIYLPKIILEVNWLFLIIASLIPLIKKKNKYLWSFLLFILLLLISSKVQLESPVLHGFNYKGGWRIIPELSAMLIALSSYTGAFIAEIIRAGIQSVDKGQTEAALALGLKRQQIMFKIILPQALQVVIPPVTSQFLNLIKNSSLSAAIGYPELVSVFAGTVLNQTGQAIEVISITMLVYLSISIFISLVMNFYNRIIVIRR